VHTRPRSWQVAVIASSALVVAVGCGSPGGSKSPESAPAPAPAAAPAKPPVTLAAAEEPLPPLPYELALPESVRAVLQERFTGDLDQMVKRRLIRAGVSYNRTNYFVDKGRQRGSTYDHLKNFEDRLNTVLKTGKLRVHVVFFPMARDVMLKALADGQLDLAEGQFTITPERRKLVDFSVPYRQNVNEIVVTPPGTPELKSADELSGREVFARKSSSYYQSLLALNQRLTSAGKPPAAIKDVPENLEDDDLLEMVNSGLLKAIVVDDYLASFWKQVFPKLTLNTSATLRTGGELGIAFRKNSPVMARAIARYSEQFGTGTTYGNIIRRQYLQDTRFVKNATTEAERRKFDATLSLFRKYGTQYDLDYLLMAAQAYQESQLDQNAKSRVGAIGIMQIMPATGKELGVGDIRQIEPNINGGIKYIRQIVDTYFEDEPMTPANKVLFAFAAYNAGPNRISQLRKETERRGLDPNVWFGNVERIVSARVGSETVDYVGNIFKYYVAYKLIVEEQERRAGSRSGLAGSQK
jgi:membrane-bound lytic murein transglycosylase MltF